MAKQKREIVVSPAGRAIFPHLHAADTKFDKDGVYSTKLELAPSAERDSLVKRLEAAFAESVAEAKKAQAPKKIKNADLPWVEQVDSEGNETGNLVFNVKLKAKGKTREGKEFTQAPKLYDAQGTLLPADTKIGGGSILKVAFEINKFYTATVGAGVSLRLKAVQVIDLKTWGDGATAESFGFGKEDGFTADTFAASTTTESAEETPEAEGGEATTQDSSDF